MSLEEQSKEMKEAIAGAMLHATILLWSIAEEIEEDYPERSQQLKDLNEVCGDLFNFFKPKEGLKIEAVIED